MSCAALSLSTYTNCEGKCAEACYQQRIVVDPDPGFVTLDTCCISGGRCCKPPAKLDDLGVCGGNSSTGLVQLTLGAYVSTTSAESESELMLAPKQSTMGSRSHRHSRQQGRGSTVSIRLLTGWGGHQVINTIIAWQAAARHLQWGKVSSSGWQVRCSCRSSRPSWWQGPSPPCRHRQGTMSLLIYPTAVHMRNACHSFRVLLVRIEGQTVELSAVNLKYAAVCPLVCVQQHCR